MKKTLVALAVVAASGASFAQVAVTGAVVMGWAGGQDSAANQTSGLGVDTATLDFGVTEDLGGGMKIIAHQGFDTLSRQKVLGGDTTMTLLTPSYSVSLLSVLAGDYMANSNANAGGNPLNGWDGRVFAARSMADAIAITIPVTASLKVGFLHQEVSANGAAGIGLGHGSAGFDSGAAVVAGAGAATPAALGAVPDLGQRANTLQVTYVGGPLAAEGSIWSWDNQNVIPAAFKSRVRGSVGYNFGVAKVGAGYDQEAYTISGTRTEAMVSVGVPIGAWNVGASLVTRIYNGTNFASNLAGFGLLGAGAFDSTFTGYSVGASYSLSKSTSIAAQYQSWSQSGATSSLATGGTGPLVNANQSNLMEIALVKSF